jgi:hypothetical protein
MQLTFYLTYHSQPIPPAGQFSHPFPTPFLELADTIFRFCPAALATVCDSLFPTERPLLMIRSVLAKPSDRASIHASLVGLIASSKSENLASARNNF